MLLGLFRLGPIAFLKVSLNYFSRYPITTLCAATSLYVLVAIYTNLMEINVAH